MDPNLERNAEDPSADPSGDLWVFGYGSLMWRPGFDFIERTEARLVGAHRALCVYSFYHRGTPERPGLVLGLDRGGTCRGIAFRVAAGKRAATIAYLRAREQVTSVYRESMRRVWLAGAGRRQVSLPQASVPQVSLPQLSLPQVSAPRVSALCYVVDRSHAQYAGRLSPAEQLHLVRQGHGQSGANRDYVIATVDAMEAMGMRDSDLHMLAERLKGPHQIEAP